MEQNNFDYKTNQKLMAYYQNVKKLNPNGETLTENEYAHFRKGFNSGNKEQMSNLIVKTCFWGSDYITKKYVIRLFDSAKFSFLNNLEHEEALGNVSVLIAQHINTMYNSKTKLPKSIDDFQKEIKKTLLNSLKKTSKKMRKYNADLNYSKIIFEPDDVIVDTDNNLEYFQGNSKKRTESEKQINYVPSFTK